MSGGPDDALDRLTRLQALTASLSQAVTSGQVADAILAQGMAVLGANAGCVTVLGDDRTELVPLRIAGAAEDVARTWGRFPLDAPVPLAEAVREGRPVVLETFAERLARYPALAGVVWPGENGAMVALPMGVRGQALGSLGWAWHADRHFTDEDRAFLLTLAELCGQALDRARLYDALRDSKERFARFMHHLPGLAWVKDAQGRYVYANDAAAGAFGKTPTELYGRTDEEVFPPATARQFRENDRQALSGGAGVRVVETLEHEDGVLHHSLVSKFPIPGTDGQAALVGGMAIDITEEMRTRAVLEESEERFRATFEQAAVGVAHVGLDGHWLRVNRKLCDIVGYGPDELMSLTFQDITHPDDLEADLALVRRLVAGEIETYSLEKRYVRRDRSLVWVNLTVSLVRTPEGQPKYFISVVKDITEKKQVQDALRESEQRLRTLSDNLPDGAIYQVLADAAGRRRFLYISAGVGRLFGVTPAEAMADAGSLYGLIHEEDRARVAAAEETALRGMAAFDCEFRSWTRPGGLRWFHCRSAPRPLPTGQTVWEGIILDVTDRVLAAEQLRRRAEEVEKLMDVLPLGVFIAHDRECCRITGNRAGYEMLRLPPGSNLSVTPPAGGTPPFAARRDGRPLAPDELPMQSAALRGVEVRDAEVEHVYPDGTAYTLFGSASPLFDAQGGVRGCVATFLDITERKRAERTILSLLRISERLNSSLDVDTLLDALVQEAINLADAESGVAGLHTAEGMVCKRYFQRGAVLPLEYCWPPMHGLPGWLIVHKVPYLTNDALADTQIVHELCVRFGVRSALSTPILNAAGEVLGFFEVHNKRAASGFAPADREMLLAVSQTAAVAIQNALAYQELQRAEEALKEADRRKDEFLATLAHELRNPLAPIRNGLQVMKLAGGNAGAVEQARAIMERQIGQMARLLDDLLDVSRITRGKLQLRKERVGLATVVQSAIEGSRPLIEASAHRMTVALPPEPVYLHADPTRLAQVFSNLLTNAAKYSDRGGHVRLTAERQGGEVVVSVRDDGIGIAPEHLPRLFQMFSQVDSALERSQGGLGIGLALVRGLVEMHGGTVEAKSEGLGQGSEFLIRLPLAGGTTAQPPRRPGGAGAAARRRILVADDNRDAADSLAMMLRLGGHEVHAVHDGQEAVDAAAWFRPDVALLDIGMPKLNGFEAARRIREQAHGDGVMLVAITGWGQEEDRRRSAQAGFDHHLTKPVDPAALERVLAAGAGAT
jgi:PAS domain S-box-containing protein